MDVYYHVKFQLSILSGSKVKMGRAKLHPPECDLIRTPPLNRVKTMRWSIPGRHVRSAIVQLIHNV